MGPILDAKIDKETLKNDIKNKAILRRMSRSVWHALVLVVWVGIGPWAAVYVAPGQY